MSTDVEAIKDALRRWASAINARRADVLSTLVSDDVVFIQPPARPFAGKAAVARLYRAAFQVYDVQARLRYEDIRVIGSLATARVTKHMQLKLRRGGAAVDFTESQAMRFRRQSKGAWKLVSHSLLAPSRWLSPFVHLAEGPVRPDAPGPREQVTLIPHAGPGLRPQLVPATGIEFAVASRRHVDVERRANADALADQLLDVLSEQTARPARGVRGPLITER